MAGHVSREDLLLSYSAGVFFVIVIGLETSDLFSQRNRLTKHLPASLRPRPAPREMAPQGGGKIVNIASLFRPARRPRRGWSC